MSSQNIPKNVDEYIAAYPENVRIKLEELRTTIIKAAPEAQEKISYRMPSFTMKGMLLYFAAHTNHIGFYPFSSAVEAFKKELVPYNTSKGTIQFPHNKPLPLNLIRKIVRFRVKENMLKAELKKNK
jgi:uncharacterized protein YdhG (YjbR/CyaY superfamily)